MEYKKDRDVYIHHTSKVKGDGFLHSRLKNKLSLDGLPALDIPNPNAYVLPDTAAEPTQHTSANTSPAAPGVAVGSTRTAFSAPTAAAAVVCRHQAAKRGTGALSLAGFTNMQAGLPTLLMLVFAWLCGAIMAKGV
jgi:hypothetical protein